jgi:hypothetical protein
MPPMEIEGACSTATIMPALGSQWRIRPGRADRAASRCHAGPSSWSVTDGAAPRSEPLDLEWEHTPGAVPTLGAGFLAEAP